MEKAVNTPLESPGRPSFEDHPGPSAYAGTVVGQGPPHQSDQELFRQLMNGFTVLAETCARFSQQVYRRSGTSPETDMEGTVERNLKIARTVFEPWCLDILAVIYLRKSIRVAELERTIGRINSRLLQAKLRKLEKMGLVQRDIVFRRRSERRYSLTHKGGMIARLGEPVFLYLRLADGWRNPAVSGTAANGEKSPIPTAVGDAQGV